MPDELRPAVFLHIQKTAGTSVQEMAREAYGNDNVISHGDYERLGLAGCRAIPFVSGHFGFAFAEALMPGRCSFTFLRNPFDRLISLYRFCRTRPPEEHPIYRAAHDGDFHGFLEPRHGRIHWATVWNNQTTQLYLGWGAQLAGVPDQWPGDIEDRTLLEGAIAHLGRFDHVGFQETFASDIARIFADLGARQISERRANVGSGENLFANLPLRTRRRLREVTELDWMLYDRAVARYGDASLRPSPVARIGNRIRHIAIRVPRRSCPPASSVAEPVRRRRD